MMFWDQGFMGWGGWLGMSVVMIAFWALVIWGVIALVRGFGRRETPQSPADILASRFASGEIDEQEYRSRLEALRGRRSRADHSV